MKTPDPLSKFYREFLENTYDCVDRIVLNAYYSLGNSAGGFRTWWYSVHGTEENLDDTHLMRMAGRFSRRVRGWAKKKDVPVVKCSKGDRKHNLAQQYLPQDPEAEGVFVIMVSRATVPVWEVLRNGEGGLHLRRKKPMPWVNHYSFHIMDREWGHVTIKMSGHPPFRAQVMLNGHEYAARQGKRRGIAYTKEGNCYTHFSGTGLSHLTDALRCDDAVGWLREVCDRWIYKCVCFGLDFESQHKSGFHYDYSVYQLEYSRNLLFSKGSDLDRIFEGLIDRNRSKLDLRRLTTIFGYKHRPWRKSKEKQPRFEVVLERPEYNLTVFKIHFGRLTLKIYSKGERVLRIESVAHNIEELRCGKRIEKFPLMVESLRKMLERYLAGLQCVDLSWITDTTLEELPKPSRLGKVEVGGVNLNHHRIRAVMEAVIALSPCPRGFQIRDLAAKVIQQTGLDYTPQKASYDLRKLRAKRMVVKLEHSRRYRPTSLGLRQMTALITLQEKVIKPLLAYSGKLKRKPRNPSPVDQHYRNLQVEMRHLFATLKIAS